MDDPWCIISSILTVQRIRNDGLSEETFLVSLSLALSLCAAICAKSLRTIEFFFLDEGFGTLDGKLVDTVMDVLGRLSKTFAVGLISHVEELKHRIENKILVTGATESHGSQVQVESY